MANPALVDDAAARAEKAASEGQKRLRGFISAPRIRAVSDTIIAVRRRSRCPLSREMNTRGKSLRS